jgi:hypothetical protein
LNQCTYDRRAVLAVVVCSTEALQTFLENYP